MTETVETNAPEDVDWSDAEGGVSYPEVPTNPHEAPLSVNFKPGGTPQLTVRGRTVAEHMELLRQVQSSGLLAVIADVSSAFGGSGAAPQAAPSPFGQPTAPPFGPNVSVPAAPGYVGPPQPAAPQWGAPAPQQGGFGAPAAGAAGTRGPKPRPSWPQVYAIDVPFAAKDAFKAFRTENQEVLKGKVAWAGGGKYWVHGDVAQGFAAYNPVAA